MMTKKWLRFTIIFMTIVISYFLVYCKSDSMLPQSVLQTERYYVDKYHIQKDYLNNIEALRLHNLFMKDSMVYKDYAPYKKYTASCGFGRYSKDWVKTNSQGITPDFDYQDKSTYLTTTVYLDTLIYNSDSLLCAGLIVVQYPYCNITDHKCYTAFDGYLLLGCRMNKNIKFDIYVYNNFSLLKQVTKEGMSKDLKEFLFRKGIEQRIPYSVKDNKFFSIPFLFGKTMEGDYNFEHSYNLWESTKDKLPIYSNDRTRNFYLPEDTVFIPYDIKRINVNQ